MNSRKFTPRPGDIIFGRVSGPMSWAIRFLSGPFPYSHVSLVAEDSQSVYTIGFGGAGRKTLGFLPASEFRQLPIADYLKGKDYVICRYKGLSKAQRAKIINWCQAELGEQYSFKKTIKMIALMFRARGIRRISGDPRKLICYEMVAQAYEAAGIDLTPRARNLAASGYDAKEIYLSPKLKDVFQRGAA